MFYLKFPGEQRKTKTNPVFFQKKSMSSTPPPIVFFSGIAYSKLIDLNWSYEALARKEALTICQDSAFASLSCVLSLSSVQGKFKHLHCGSGLWRRGAVRHGK